MSKKVLNIDAITNELEGASSFFPTRQPMYPTTGEKPKEQNQQVFPQALGQPIDQPVSQSTNRSTSPSPTKLVDRPKAFYITERLDKQLDQAVRYFQEKHGIKKVDRSTIVNAILDNEANWTEESLNLLVSRVISQLTSRLMS
ncbi:MAG: hypothetical protein EXR62_07735 [Chloroflexi bacterium]|nr:hypothetical protein [Chloroflexota bacterium]